MKLKKMMAAIMTMSMVAAMMPTIALAEETTEVVAEVTTEVAADAVAEVGGTTYATLAAAVAAAEDGAEIKLLKDAEGPGIVIDKNITINFGGNVYDIIGPAVGSAGTTTLGFQILKDNKVTLENGTITESTDGALEQPKAVKMLVQNYANLTLDNMVLDGKELGGSGRYTLSNNSGTVAINNTTVIADENGIAFDACQYDPYPVPTVTVAENSVVDGKIEVTGAAKLVIEGGSFTDLANAVKYAEDDATITLLDSVKGPGIVIDKDITIDFNKKVYNIIGPAVGSDGTTTLGFQILKNNDVTLKNGTITESTDGALEQPKAVKMLVQNYANLTLDNMVLDGKELGGSGRYTLSNNSGTVAINNTTVIADENGIAFDACQYDPYPVPTVTVAENSVVDGKIEVTGAANLVIKGGSFTDLANAVNYAVSGAELTLLKSVEGSGIVIDKPIKINFAEHTYTFTEPAVGSTGTTSNGFQILQESGKVTLMNGALKVADAHRDKYYILIQNYADLTVNGMTLDGTNLDKYAKSTDPADGDSYTLSNNHGDVVITGNTTIIANNDGAKAFAFDVCDYANYDGVTVTFDASFTGGVKGAFEVDSSEEAKLVIHAGYFTQDPTAYKAEGKEVKDSDQVGYTFMVGEPTSEPTPEPTPSRGGGSSSPKYTASVDKGDVENGGVKLSSTKAKAGSKVTVTVTPDAGYELNKLVILDKNGKEVKVTDNSDGTFTFVMPKGGVEVVPEFVEETKPAEEEKTTLILTIDQRVYQQDGNYAVNDVAPVISGARTFLPIRLVAETLGATVGWDAEIQAVTIVDADTTIVIYIGQAYATVNGVPVQLDAPAFIANGRTYLPVRFVAENLGATVSWDADTKEVTIVG